MYISDGISTMLL